MTTANRTSCPAGQVSFHYRAGNAIASNCPTHPIIVSSDQIIRLTTADFAAVLGYHLDELMSGNFAISALISEDAAQDTADHGKWVERWFSDPAPLCVSARGPVPIKCRDGYNIYALISIVPWIDQDDSALNKHGMPKFSRYGIAYITPVPDLWASHKA